MPPLQPLPLPLPFTSFQMLEKFLLLVDSQGVTQAWFESQNPALPLTIWVTRTSVINLLEPSCLTNSSVTSNDATHIKGLAQDLEQGRVQLS